MRTIARVKMTNLVLVMKMMLGNIKMHNWQKNWCCSKLVTGKVERSWCVSFILGR